MLVQTVFTKSTYVSVCLLFVKLPENENFIPILDSDWLRVVMEGDQSVLRIRSCDILVPVLIPDTCDAREFDELVRGRFPEVPPCKLFVGQALPARKS